jgi:lysophospholipase L1-like esterase
MKSKTHRWGLLLLAGVPWAVGCNSDGTPTHGTGGSSASSGGSGSGGVTATGGTVSTGGKTTGTGGGSGGTSGSGGMVSTGGTTATGGTSSQGGGSTGVGGSSARTGGATGTGGGTATGSSAPAGGATGTGGRSGTGGSPATGGTVGTGGTVATGGTVGTGGIGGGNRDGGADVRVGTDSIPDGITAGDVDPAKKITVWLAGDSTMQPCSSACPCGWGSQFQPYFNANVTVVNSGAGGRSIQTWLYDPNVTTTMSNGECVVNPKTYSTRWQAMLDGMKAGDYLFIEFGINDGDSTCNRHVGTALFQSYLEYMAGEAKTRGAQAIFLTSTSAIACSGSTAQANRGFGPQTKAAGSAAGVPVIDLTVLSAALYGSLGLCPNASDYTSTTSAVGKFFCDDHTHFEAAGATQIAGVVAKALRDQGIGLAAYLK